MLFAGVLIIYIVVDTMCLLFKVQILVVLARYLLNMLITVPEGMVFQIVVQGGAGGKLKPKYEIKTK